MISAISNNISAVFTFSRKMAVQAKNIANTNTDGYKKSRADVVTLSSGNVGLEVTRVETPGIAYVQPGTGVASESANVDPVSEISQMVPTTIGYKANLKMVAAQDEMLGTLLDIHK